jgi:hypothetical protein
MHSLCMMESTNIRNLKIKINGNLIHIQRRKGTQNPSPMPPDPKEKREIKERNAHTVTKDSIRNAHACMQKIDLMSQILQQNNLGDPIPKGAKKKKPEDLNSKKDNSSHALIFINSSPDAWIVDSGASNHLVASKAVYYYLDACKGPTILMGDNSFVEVTGKGRIELTNGSFENVLHIPNLSVNLLSMYQMMNYGTVKKVIFTPNSVDIYDMQTNSGLLPVR